MAVFCKQCETEMVPFSGDITLYQKSETVDKVSNFTAEKQFICPNCKNTFPSVAEIFEQIKNFKKDSA